MGLEDDARNEFSPFSLFLMELGRRADPSINYLVGNVLANRRRNLSSAYDLGYETGEVPETVTQRNLFASVPRDITEGERRYAQLGAQRYGRLAASDRLSQLRVEKLASDLYDLYGTENPEAQDYIDLYLQNAEPHIPKRVREQRADTRAGAKDLVDVINSLGKDSSAFIGKFRGYEDILADRPDVFRGESVAGARERTQNRADNKALGGGDTGKNVKEVSKFYAKIIADLNKQFVDVVSGNVEIEGIKEPITVDIPTLQRRAVNGPPLTARERKALELWTARKWAENKYAIASQAVEQGFTDAGHIQIYGNDPTDVPSIDDPSVNPFAAAILKNRQDYLNQQREQQQQPVPFGTPKPGIPGLLPAPQPTPFPQLNQGVDLNDLYNREFGVR